MKKTLLLGLFAASALILGPSIAQALTIDPFTTAFDTGAPVKQYDPNEPEQYRGYYGESFSSPYGGIAQQRGARAYYGSTTRISSTGNGVANVTLGTESQDFYPGVVFLDWSDDISYQTRNPLNLGGTKAFQFNVTDWNSPSNSPVKFFLNLWDGIESPPAPFLKEWSIEHTVSTSGMLEFNFGHVSDADWAEISYVSLMMYRDDYSPGDISFNIGPIQAGSVPDGGMTLALLGSALTGLAALRRKFIA